MAMDVVPRVPSAFPACRLVRDARQDPLMLTANLLQIHHDRVRRGREAVYRTAEEDAARSCAVHGCPHPHLAIESVAAPMDVWWLNAFDSEADRQRVSD